MKINLRVCGSAYLPVFTNYISNASPRPATSSRAIISTRSHHSTKILSRIQQNMFRSTATSASHLARSHSSICAALSTPVATDEEWEEAWSALSYVSQLPLEDLRPFESALQALAQIDTNNPPPGKGSYGLASGAGDVIKFINNPRLVWVPQHKFDYMAQRTLTERVSTAEEMRPHMVGLFNWLADRNWPPWEGCYNQLKRFPEATVGPIKEILAADDDAELLENILDFVTGEIPKGPAWDELAPCVLTLQAKAKTKTQEEIEEGFWDIAEERFKEWMKEYEEWKREIKGPIGV